MVQQYFSDSEWSVLMRSPIQAVVGLILADKTDPVSFLKEAQAAVRILAEELQREDVTSDLVKSLIDSWKQESATDGMLQGEELLLKKEFELLGYIQNLKNADEGRKHAIAHFEQVASILGAKVTSVQASEVKQWLLGIAQKVAESVKESGFLGVGGERVSSAEASMLKKLEQAMEIKI